MNLHVFIRFFNASRRDHRFRMRNAVVPLVALGVTGASDVTAEVVRLDVSSLCEIRINDRLLASGYILAERDNLRDFLSHHVYVHIRSCAWFLSDSSLTQVDYVMANFVTAAPADIQLSHDIWIGEMENSDFFGVVEVACSDPRHSSS